MTWADDLEEWKRQQDQARKTKESREKFKAADGNKAEWQRIYKNYRASSIWQEIKKRKLAQVGFRCELCSAQYISESGLQVHHKNYDRVGGLEKDSDLQVVCAGECHHRADEFREERVETRRRHAKYEQWFENWGIKKYRDKWEIEKYDRELEVEEEFQKHAYKKWCEDNGKHFNSYIRIPDDFIEMLEDGRYDEYEEYTPGGTYYW